MNSLTHQSMERRIQDYFDDCNRGDGEAVARHFVPEAVHYFPPGMYQGPFTGATTIGARWADAVAHLGSVWTLDQVITDPASARAVVEWTHFKTKQGTMLRGDEWYLFDEPSGLIREIRAYYASPQAPDLERLELGGFDYKSRGYAVEPPFTRDP